MSGGHFDYGQFHIQQIAESIEILLEEIARPRPPEHIERWVSVKMKTGENTYSSCLSVYERVYRCESLQEARNVLRRLFSRSICEKDGHFYDAYETWTDKNGVEHPCEYELKLCESMEYDQGYEDTCYYGNEYKPETIAEFQNGLKYLKKAYVYAQRIDWLISGDDGEESFHERLKEDLAELDKD